MLYSEFKFDGDARAQEIQSDETRVAKVLKKYSWEYLSIDLFREHFEHMKKKRKIGLALKDQFIQEGNDVLFRKIITESIDEGMPFGRFLRFTNRYLYCIEK